MSNIDECLIKKDPLGPFKKLVNRLSKSLESVQSYIIKRYKRYEHPEYRFPFDIASRPILPDQDNRIVTVNVHFLVQIITHCWR